MSALGRFRTFANGCLRPEANIRELAHSVPYLYKSVVIDRDLLHSTPEQIADARVLSTMMNGRVVFNDAVGWGERKYERFEDYEGLDFCASHDE